MTKDYGLDNTNDFLTLLNTDIVLPKKTRDIYLYLPYRMLDIYPTVKVFSNLDLMNGDNHKRPLFYMTRRFKNQNGILHLGNNIALDMNDNTIQIGSKKQAIRRFTVAGYDENGELKTQERLLSFSSNVNVIYMKSYNTFLVLDEQTYNSTYIQLMVLEKYDKNLYEAVNLTPLVKVYKLKI